MSGVNVNKLFYVLRDFIVQEIIGRDSRFGDHADEITHFKQALQEIFDQIEDHAFDMAGKERTIKVKKLTELAKLPEYKTAGAGCFDLYCSEDTLLPRGDVVKVPTGLAFEVPEGYVLTILPRSSACLQKVQVFVGQVDSDYRGEICAIARNLREGAPILIHAGERIAQGRLDRAEQVEFETFEELSETDRGTSGFGGTGR